MSETIGYQLESTADFARLEQVLQRMAAHFGVETHLRQGEVHRVHLERKALPQLEPALWPTLANVSVTGHLNVKSADSEGLRVLLDAAAACASDSPCRVLARVGFEERESRQNKRGYDTLSIEVRADKQMVNYSANGSKAATDKEYCQALFGQMIQALDLPLGLEAEAGVYRLAHQQDGFLRTTGGFKGRNPTGFWCEVPANTGNLLSALVYAEKTLSSGKVFARDWVVSANPELGPRPGAAACAQVLALLMQSQPQAEHFEITLNYLLDDAAQLAGLRALCEQDDVIFTDAFTFEQPGGGLGYVRIATQQHGYTVLVDASEPIDQGALQQATGQPVEALS